MKKMTFLLLLAGGMLVSAPLMAQNQKKEEVKKECLAKKECPDKKKECKEGKKECKDVKKENKDVKKK